MQFKLKRGCKIKILFLYIFGFSAGLFVDCNAHGFSSEFNMSARTQPGSFSSLVEKSLAYACLGMSSLPDSLPCNPAWLFENKKSALSGHFLVSNGYGNLEKTRKILSGTANDEIVSLLSSDEKILQSEGDGSIFFRSKYLAGSYTPYNISILSVVRDETNPKVDFVGISQSQWVLQSAYELKKNFSIGIQLRGVERSYVANSFYLLEAATEDGKKKLAANKTTNTYAEPGLVYLIPEYWGLNFSIMKKNLQLSSSSDLPANTPASRIDPESTAMGVGLNPPMRWGQLSLSVDYRQLTDLTQRDVSFMHYGSLYKYGTMSLSAGADDYGFSGGIFFSIEKLNSGILFTTTKVPWIERSSYSQTVYTQFGMEI